jgi:hypothetical protein
MPKCRKMILREDISLGPPPKYSLREAVRILKSKDARVVLREFPGVVMELRGWCFGVRNIM